MVAKLTLHYAPQTRAFAVRTLLEELKAPYELNVLTFKKDEQRAAAYLAINPMGKVPAISHGDALITEQPAIFIYLADLFPAATLAPALTDPLRGPYLRWMVFYGSCFETALVDKSMGHAPTRASTSPYGDYDTTMNTLGSQLAKGPYILGETFSAADILWGTALAWTMIFKLVPETPVFAAYSARVNARPSMAFVRGEDAKLVAERDRDA